MNVLDCHMVTAKIKAALLLEFSHSDVLALAWRLKPAKASCEKPGQARLFAWLSKACGSGFDF
jgi:hypothetical protein